MRTGFGNTLADMSDALAAVETACAGWQVPRPLALRTVLLLEELAGNAIRHGYPDGRRGHLALHLAWDGSAMQCELRDDGDAFDPLAAPPPDRSLPATERPPGGFGLGLVRRLAADLAYRRDAGGNRIRFTVPRRPDER